MQRPDGLGYRGSFVFKGISMKNYYRVNWDALPDNSIFYWHDINAVNPVLEGPYTKINDASYTGKYQFVYGVLRFELEQRYIYIYTEIYSGPESDITIDDIIQTAIKNPKLFYDLAKMLRMRALINSILSRRQANGQTADDIAKIINCRVYDIELIDNVKDDNEICLGMLKSYVEAVNLRLKVGIIENAETLHNYKDIPDSRLDSLC